ncbi:MAG: glycosyltransferase family 4 protein [Candidatus Hodarchaeota archaeon]
MNILRLTTRIYPDEGGPAVYAYNLSKNLSDSSYRFINLSCQPPRIRYRAKKVNSNFLIFYMPLRIPSVDDTLTKKMIFIFKFIFYSLRSILKIRHKYRIDLIHCDNPAITGIVATIMKCFFKIPFLYTQHGIESPYKLEKLIETRFIYKLSSNYLIISRKMKRFFVNSIKDPKKLIYIPNGVKISDFFHVSDQIEKQNIINKLKLSSIVQSDDYIIIYIGYMIFQQKVKGMIDFLHGFNSLLKDLDTKHKRKIKLLYIGDGKFLDILEMEISKLKLNENAFILGRKSNVKEYYAIADLCTLTSYVEGFPTVLLEAIASKVPCLATNIGEIKQIIHESALVKPGDIMQIKEKLRNFMFDHQFAENNLKISIELLKDYDWEVIGKKIKNTYLNALNIY